jgi:riboflavin synthase
MFTGLVEETGRVLEIEGGGMTCLRVRAEAVSRAVEVGDSISVNGACLTVGEVSGDVLTFHAMPETLRRTALGRLSGGSLVNLERAMRAGDRLGGHLVQGHVDGVGEVIRVEAEGGAEIWTFGAPEEVLRYAVEKGSVCVDGISLTIVSVLEDGFTVSILPQTREKTNLRDLRAGDAVNLEADVIGKYVERLVEPWIERATHRVERSVKDAV